MIDPAGIPSFRTADWKFRLIDGRYRVARVLARTDTTAVLVVDDADDVERVLKVVRHDGDDARFLQVIREFDIVRSIEHSGVVRAHRVFELDEQSRIVSRIEHAEPRISLDGHYKLISDFDERFPHGPPSLRECTSLAVEGLPPGLVNDVQRAWVPAVVWLEAAGAIALAVPLYITVAAWHHWRAADVEWPNDAPDTPSRDRFLAVTALTIALFGIAAAIALWLPSLFLSACDTQ